ncbi:DMT family transporter [Ferroacidibacillus organovorans]|nr:EamA family transporter [Ferroacidibacillus organovorans]
MSRVNPLIYGSLVILTTALMGSSFAVGKIGLEYVSPLLLVGIRFTLAGMLMALFVLKRRHPGSLAAWLRVFTIGLFQSAGVMGCIFISLRTITASESSILTFMNPLFVVIFGTLFTKTRYRLIQWVGVTLGFIGVFVTLGFHLHLHFGTLLGLLGAVSWAVATLLIKRWGPQIDTWVLTAYQMLFGGLLLLIGSVTLEQPHISFNVVSISILVWLSIMASIVQFAIWFYLLQHGDPGKTSAFLFLAPFFGVLSGWLILGEPVRDTVLIGGFFIFAGIFLVNWPESKKKRAWLTD